MLAQIVLTVLFSEACVGIYYDSYTGQPAEDCALEKFRKLNILANCTNDIVLPCDENEYRRLDGSCNNLDYPSSGCTHTPLTTLLPPVYGEGFTERTAASGKALPLARVARTRLLANGKVSDTEFTQMISFMTAIPFADVGTVHDTLNYLTETTTCCTKAGETEPMCSPIQVPEDDPTHRYSGIRCLNLTKPKTFQTYGCAASNTVPSRIEFATPLLDMSFIYRSNEPMANYRSYKNGMLLYEEENGSIWPWSQGPNNVTSCMANVRENNETRCFGVVQGSIPPVTVGNVCYYRLHNIIASKLAELNPHWTDEKLFYTARDINIAIYNQKFFYELYPILLGKQYAKDYGLISEDSGFRDCYNKSIKPQVSFDYMYGLRSLHESQEGTLKLYDKNYRYKKQLPAVNLTLRVGYLSQEDNFADICRGIIVQHCGAVDHVVDNELSEQGLGGMQRSTDLLSADLKKGRLFGVAPYVDYIKASGRPKPTSWEDLTAYLDWEYVLQLQELYECVEDVDLLVGLWGEDKIEGGFVPPTLAFIIAENMKTLMVADRHWYERADRPHAFSYDQLQEIRKANFAHFICVTEPKIEYITRDPFRIISESNPLVPCSELPQWNLEAWKEDTDDC